MLYPLPSLSDQSREEEKVYQQMVVDAQVFLAREIERKLASCDSDSHDRYERFPANFFLFQTLTFITL